MSTKDLKQIVYHQVKLEGLWIAEPTVTEYLLMAALRHLHALIEDKPIEAELAKNIYWEMEK